MSTYFTSSSSDGEGAPAAAQPMPPDIEEEMFATSESEGHTRPKRRRPHSHSAPSGTHTRRPHDTHGLPYPRPLRLYVSHVERARTVHVCMYYPSMQGVRPPRLRGLHQSRGRKGLPRRERRKLNRSKKRPRHCPAR